MRRATVESLSRKFHEHQGYRPNLSDPKTLQEKILWRLLYEDMSEAVRLADKVAVRDYVREKVGEEYLVEALAIADSADDLAFDSLPDAFVLKVNHMSGANILVKDRSTLDVDATRRALRILLKVRFGTRTGEHWYGAIPPKVLVERLLVDSRYEVPIEYNLHVFHGRVEYVSAFRAKALTTTPRPEFPGTAGGAAFINRRTSVLTNYDVDWNPAPYQGSVRDPEIPFDDPEPSRLKEMIAIAQELAADWGYVRIDFNCIDDREVYFAEMTFSPASGLRKLAPEHYNEYLGGLWDIHHRFVRSDHSR